jgi:hypothetical protein
MAEYFGKQLLLHATNGDIDSCRNALNNNADINYLDKEMKGAGWHAINGAHTELMRFLMSKNMDMSVQDVNGETLMHLACTKKNKYIVLYMLLEGVDYQLKNNANQEPGHDAKDMKAFMKEIVEEYRCFNKMPKEEVFRVTQLFEDIDYDNKKSIDGEKAAKFNKFVDKKVNNWIAEKDAGDFIESAAIIDGDTCSFDEWYYAWAKTYIADRRIYDKFFKEYETVLKESDLTFKELMNAQDEL